jgi:hypothetical protein
LPATHGTAGNANSQMRPGTRVNEGRRSMTVAKLEVAPDTKPGTQKQPGVAPKACLRVAFALEALCTTFKTVSRWLPRGLSFPVARAT